TSAGSLPIARASRWVKSSGPAVERRPPGERAEVRGKGCSSTSHGGTENLSHLTQRFGLRLRDVAPKQHYDIRYFITPGLLFTDPHHLGPDSVWSQLLGHPHFCQPFVLPQPSPRPGREPAQRRRQRPAEHSRRLRPHELLENIRQQRGDGTAL